MPTRGVILRTVLIASLLLKAFPIYAASEVVVVYNNAMPESKAVAEYYASKRDIPSSHVFGFELPKTETITREEYENKLEKPLLKALESSNLLVFRDAPDPLHPGQTGKLPAQAKIRYATLCYGVPVKILRDSALKEDEAEKLAPPLNRNEASVDAELATLPLHYLKPMLAGPLQNRLFSMTNSAAFNPTNGILMVARLDGPSAEIARGLVDKAIAAEHTGLWGRGYFDARGLTNGPYKVGDDWITGAAQLAFRYGYETTLDNLPSTFSSSFPVSQIAFYFGWYDWDVSGPFARDTVEFMPGAIAYHLHSFSASILRTTQKNWVGPLLAHGATASIGYTEEPYLEGTIDIPIFFSRFTFLGFSFGEAAYASQRSLSWQTTVVGDPLYSPWSIKPPIRFAQLEAAKSPLIEWAHLQVVNMLLAQNQPFEEIVQYLESTAETKTSSVLSEKLGDLYRSKGKLSECLDPYIRALSLKPTPQQRIRIVLSAGKLLSNFDKDQEVYDACKEVIRVSPDYPGMKEIYSRFALAAEKLGKKDEAAEFKKLANPASAG